MGDPSVSAGSGPTQAPQRRPEWTSQRAFVIASIAGAVGLGNLWRFPYMVGLNGGGTFIVAYAVSIFAIGLPLFILESSAGSLIDRGPVGVFRRAVARGGRVFGWVIVAVAVVIMSYYFVITGWTLGYLVDAVRGDLRPFGDFTAGYRSVWWFLAVGVLVYLVLWRGTGGVERLGKFLLPVLVLAVAALAVYAQTLDGASEARAFYGSFDPALFLEPHTWQMAMGQAFYSLGVGTGLLITYGSYVPRNVNIVTSSAAVALTNAAISLTAGLAVFSIVFTFGLAPDAGSQLSFTAFPAIFDHLAGGRVLGAVFFGLLFAAAFSSCYSALMVAIAPLRDEFRLSASKAAALTVGVTLALGLPSALSFTPAGLAPGGTPVLDWVDRLAGSGVVVALGIGGAALIAWRLPKSRLVAEMTAGEWRIGPLRLTPYGIVEVARFMPAAAIVLLVITALV